MSVLKNYEASSRSFKMRSISIGKKIWFSISILILGYSISMVTGYFIGKKTESGINNISQSLFPSSNHIQEALTAFKDVMSLYNDAIMFGDEERLNSAVARGKDVRSSLEAISALDGLNEDMKIESESLSKSVTSFNAEAEPVYTALSQGDESDVMVRKASNLAKQNVDLKKRIVSLKNGLAENLQKELSAIDQRTKHQQRLTVIIFFAVVSITLVLIWIIVNRYIMTPINSIIEDLNHGADQLATASDEIAAASQTLAEATSEQAASLEETAAALGDVSSMTHKNEDSANQADILTKESSGFVAGAKKSMEDLSMSMDEISTASQDTSKIIKTIDEIAFQTNLLALNAAVEAARAGEAGAGFAVVADEVRNLAMRAAEAATNTTALIESTIAKVDTGTDLVSRTRDAVMKAEESSNKVTGLISEISEASREQTRNIEQINTAVTEIDNATQNSAANAEESAAASSEMHAQTTKMRTRIDELQIIIYGRTDTVSEPLPQNRRIKPVASHTRSQQQAYRSLPEPVSGSSKRMNPEEIIPMDKEDSFTDF